MMLAGLVAAAGPASAGASGVDGELRAQLRNCLEIPSALRRLDCFDRLARESVGGGHEISSAPSDPSADGSRDAAGARPPPRTETPNPNQAIRSTLTRLEQRPRGEWVFHLRNGQIWTEIEPGRTRYEEGSEVRITRTLFGSYMLSVEGIRATRVRRLQ